MKPIIYRERLTGKRCEERVYGAAALKLLYGTGWVSTLLGRPLCFLASRYALFSRLVGWWQNRNWTARHIAPFVAAHEVDVSEFQEPVERFRSFNDFFIRKLKPSSRPLAEGEKVAICPADGRYLAFQEFAKEDWVDVKGRRLDLTTLLQDPLLARRYEKGSLIVARLCPSDYHRFHFPVTCQVAYSRLIKGSLYSVNPIAIYRRMAILAENKRLVTLLQSEAFGDVLMIEVGATSVGSIHQTYSQGPQPLLKGAEKGYFSFGGSCILLLFLPGAIRVEEDLLEATKSGLETRCLMGQPLGTCSR